MDRDDRLNHDAVNTLISLRDAAEVEADSIKEDHSFKELSDARQSRTYHTMEEVNPSVAKTIIPQQISSNGDVKEKAAVVIQSHYRGYVDRCKFLGMLYEQFEKEEEERKKKTTEQVEEGELLVANRKLEMAVDDAETTARNKQRLYETRVITIQRAWKSYKRRQLQTGQHEKDKCNADSSPSCRRKSNILNKAQEFADLKKQFDDVLPYDAHKATPLSDSSIGSSQSTSTENSPSTESLSILANLQDKTKTCTESEVTLPALDWTALEHNLTHSDSSTVKASASKSVKDAHREDVRKRLAMNTPGEGLYGEVYTRPPPKPYRGATNTMELYMNDCNDEVLNVSGDDSNKDLATKQQKLHEQAEMAYIQAGPIAKRMIEVEKMAEEPSEIARMLGISTFKSTGEVTLNKTRLLSLTLPQLQIVYNAMQNEIERLNEELVEVVVMRDELHMQQDSILVNIEDLERRIEELSKKHNRRVEQKEAKKTVANNPPKKSTSRMSRLFQLGRTS